jgi:TetR/AcrR family transcriptional repressor of mexJK operon
VESSGHPPTGEAPVCPGILPEAAAELVKASGGTIVTHCCSSGTQRDAATLQRILAAQAVQFPELAKLAHEDGWLRGVRGVAILLRQFAARGEIKVDDLELAADLFLNLLLGHSARLALHGIADNPEFLERRRQAVVELIRTYCNGRLR